MSISSSNLKREEFYWVTVSREEFVELKSVFFAVLFVIWLNLLIVLYSAGEIWQRWFTLKMTQLDARDLNLTNDF